MVTQIRKTLKWSTEERESAETQPLKRKRNIVLTLVWSIFRVWTWRWHHHPKGNGCPVLVGRIMWVYKRSKGGAAPPPKGKIRMLMRTWKSIVKNWLFATRGIINCLFRGWWQSHRMNWKYWFKTGKHMKTDSWWLVDHNLRVFCLKIISYVVKDGHLQNLEISNESTPNNTFKFEHEEWYSIFGDTSLHVVLFVYFVKTFFCSQDEEAEKTWKTKNVCFNRIMGRS